MKKSFYIAVWMVLVSGSFLLLGCGQATRGSEEERASSPDAKFEFEESYASAVNTRITSSPANPSNSPDAIFKFKCNKKSCAFKCKLDGDAWSSCKSPKNYTGLSNGSHTFKVKAKDKGTGLWDKTPAKYEWTIDLAVSVSAGGGHTCAVLSSGAVKCWGYNLFGQLGNGTNNSSNVPVDVSGLSGVSSVSGGGIHTCGLLSTGGIKCWGKNGSGQLGTGNTIDSNIPADVTNLSSGVAGISAGGNHTCAVLSSGLVKCWGNNYYGQLGNGNNNNSNVPVDVFGLSSGISAISTGEYHTCALSISGGVKCWGKNDTGQLGNGSNVNSNVPVDVSGLSSGVNAVSGGAYHTCALLSSGGLKCWGYNYYGQLGNGSNVNSNVPVDVSGLSSGVNAVATGYFHTCALLSSGAVKCWGRNDSGQLGTGNTNDSNVPVEVLGLSSGVSEISTGDSHTCALLSSGRVKCWGFNSDGELGNGNNDNSYIPVNVVGF